MWMVGAASVAGGMALAACHAESRTQGRFGFTISPPTPGLSEFRRDVRAVSDLGVAWVRFGVVANDVVASWFEDNRVRFDDAACETYRQAFDIVEAEGLRVNLLTVDGVAGVPDEEVYLRLMGQYWSGVAKRFGTRVDIWQVFNEANDLDFRSASPIRGSIDEYHAALDRAIGRARASIHQFSPSVAVTTNAGGYPVNDATERNWQRFFAAVGGSLDIVTVDIYPVLSEAANATLPARFERLRELTGKPLAVGEFGLQTGEQLYSEAEQVASLTTTITELAETCASPIFVYRLRDDGAENDDGFGLFEQNGQAKSSFAPVARVISEKFPEG